MNIQFGSGVLFGAPNSGNLAANPTPVRFGLLQDVQVTFKGDLKKLYGQSQFPAASARGKIDVSAKGKLAVIDPLAINQLYFGQSSESGITLIADQEPQVVPALATPASHATTHAYALGAVITDGTNVEVCVIAGTSGGSAPTWNATVGGLTVDDTATFLNVGAAVGGKAPVSIVTVNNAADAAYDYGVQYATNAQQLVTVPDTASPTVGEYTPLIAYGLYLFAPTDVGSTVLISYTYTASGRGSTITLASQLMGYAPYFQALLYNNMRGKFFGLQLNSCIMGTLGIPTKQDDWWILDVDFDAVVDASNTLGKIYADLV